MYKVFINDKSLILTDNLDDYASAYDTLFIKFGSKDVISSLTDLLHDSPVLKSIVIYHDNLEELWKTVNENFENVEAAGGVVRNDGKVLFILKNGIWDLPKGKVESSESVQDAALREVKEECGIKDLKAADPLNPTYHIYKEDSKSFLKKTNWFLMNTNEEGPFSSDSREGITEVKWMDNNEWNSVSGKSYASLVNLMSAVFK